jgi:tRNA 2-selenouridine synthase
VEVPVAERVRFLIAEYGHFLAEPGWLKAKLLRLSALHSRETVERWISQIDACQWEPLVSDLLSIHYDPAYARSMGDNYAGMAQPAGLDLTGLSSGDLDRAAAALLADNER